MPIPEQRTFLDDLLLRSRDASTVGYDNSESGLDATNVQEAIDEIAGGGGGGPSPSDATPEAVSTSSGVAGVATTYSRSDHVHLLSDIESGTFAFDESALSGWTVSPTPSPFRVDRVGSVVTVSGQFVMTITTTGLKYMRLQLPALTSPPDFSSGIMTVLTGAGIGEVGQISYYDTGTVQLRVDNALTSGDCTVYFNFRYTAAFTPVLTP